jgi:hypothetical protein
MKLILDTCVPVAVKGSSITGFDWQEIKAG